MNLGKILKKIRKENKLSQEEVCDIFATEYGLNVNKSMVSRWENEIAFPDGRHVMAYAKYFNIDINYLYGLVKERRRLSDLVSNEDVSIYKAIVDSKNKELILKIVNKLNLHEEKYLEHLLEIL